MLYWLRLVLVFVLVLFCHPLTEVRCIIIIIVTLSPSLLSSSSSSSVPWQDVFVVLPCIWATDQVENIWIENRENIHSYVACVGAYPFFFFFLVNVTDMSVSLRRRLHHGHVYVVSIGRWETFPAVVNQYLGSQPRNTVSSLHWVQT